VVSASHNPWRDNGIKVFGRGGLKLSDEREAALEARVEALPAAPGKAPAPAPAPAARERADGAAAYERWLLQRFAGLKLSDLSLAVDCANGSACVAAPAVLSALGARVTPLFDKPDGRNINEGCGSTHLSALAGHVAGGRFDLGFAFDGDADRVLFVDRAGRTCDGDHMLGFLGPWLDRRGELPGGVVVASVMSNLGLERTLSAAGLRLLRSPVGDRHVLAALKSGGYGLGGEASGHVIFREGGHFVGDGLFTALRMLEALTAGGTDLAAVIDAVPRVPQVLLNVPVAARPPVESLSGLQAAVASAQARHGGDLRIVLRYSGTENLARVMVEGLDAGVVRSLADELARLWTAEIEAHAR
jgi:phosphoglucosamine mutase